MGEFFQQFVEISVREFVRFVGGKRLTTALNVVY